MSTSALRTTHPTPPMSSFEQHYFKTIIHILSYVPRPMSYVPHLTHCPAHKFSLTVVHARRTIVHTRLANLCYNTVPICAGFAPSVGTA